MQYVSLSYPEHSPVMTRLSYEGMPVPNAAPQSSPSGPMPCGTRHDVNECPQIPLYDIHRYVFMFIYTHLCYVNICNICTLHM